MATKKKTEPKIQPQPTQIKIKTVCVSIEQVFHGLHRPTSSLNRIDPDSSAPVLGHQLQSRFGSPRSLAWPAPPQAVVAWWVAEVWVDTRGGHGGFGSRRREMRVVVG
ncbi:unnamed protein product [Sphenostylis stenocarpa]|uniref:Uncharacterized protein n=1 Tax=Sphenostylis stenocarpa TaxID=92480 RepID=A0AA86SLZ5_9FABA|nr:unnamed protein product [Sphenostylis stenocarpa]